MGKKQLDSVDIYELIRVREQNQTINQQGHNVFKCMETHNLEEFSSFLNQELGK